MKDDPAKTEEPPVKSLVLAALLAGAVASFAAIGFRGPPSSLRGGAPAVSGSARALAAPCPPGSLPDEGVCIPVSAPQSATRGPSREQIPRRPERPAELDRYALPVGGATAREASPERSPDGGLPLGGLVLQAPPGTPVAPVHLEGEVLPAHVVYAGPLPLVGATVVSLHRVGEGDRARLYFVVLGPLDAAPALAPRAELPPGVPVGHTTDGDLHLDVRRLRTGVDPFALAPQTLLDDATSVDEDPRNVLAKAR